MPPIRKVWVFIIFLYRNVCGKFKNRDFSSVKRRQRERSIPSDSCSAFFFFLRFRRVPSNPELRGQLVRTQSP